MTAPLRREFVADASAPSAARRFAVAATHELLTSPPSDALCADLELVVSELVTNAVRTGSRVARVEIAVEQARVVVRVEDEGKGWPLPREAGIHDTTGRGLALVSALSLSWGVRLSGTDRKTVWAQLPVDA